MNLAKIVYLRLLVFIATFIAIPIGMPIAIAFGLSGRRSFSHWLPMPMQSPSLAGRCSRARLSPAMGGTIYHRSTMASTCT